MLTSTTVAFPKLRQSKRIRTSRTPASSSLVLKDMQAANCRRSLGLCSAQPAKVIEVSKATLKAERSGRSEPANCLVADDILSAAGAPVSDMNMAASRRAGWVTNWADSGLWAT